MIAATMSNIRKVMVTPTKAAVSKHRDSAGTELRFMTTSSLSSSASLNCTSDGETTLIILSVVCYLPLITKCVFGVDYSTLSISLFCFSINRSAISSYLHI